MMRVLKKHQETVKVQVETPDDLWYLYTILDEGDVCTGSSEYKYKPGETGKNVRKRVWVAIEVDKTEYRQQTGQLRISGSVVDGSEEVPRGSHHSLDVQAGTELEIRKERWLDYHHQRLREAQESDLRTLLLLFDRERALFALLRPNGHEKLSELKGEVAKKAFDQGQAGGFYSDIVKRLREYIERYDIHRAVIASPSFWKDYLQKELPDDLKEKVVFAAVSTVDESAIPELLKRPELQQALAGERAAREAEMVERAMEALAKDKLVYGEEDLSDAIEQGNVSELFVTERKIMDTREDDTFDRVEDLMRSASDVGASVHVISTNERLDGLGGIAGVKRW